MAILFIVAVHAMTAFSWSEDPSVAYALSDLLANGTVFFIFISGYLFQHLSANYRYPAHLAKKVKYVLMPYLIASIPAIGYTVFRGNPVEDYPFLEGTSVAYQILWFYVTGATRIDYPMWFIPVILVYYLVSPAFYAFTRYPVLYWLILLLLPVSLLAHRPHFPNPGILHSFVYFLSAYVLGMFTSQYRQNVVSFLEKNVGIFFVVFLAYYILQFVVSDQHGSYRVDQIFSFERGYIDWAFLQKIILAFLMLGLMSRYDSVVSKPLRPLGDTAFSIYFLHAYVIYAFRVITAWHTYQGSVLRVGLLSGATVAVCYAITKLVNRVLGEYSRMVIGT